ncbi:MAG: MFS transporter [Asgard group archaeon]|nr:MFS transporter [Asgard group archaeon]
MGDDSSLITDDKAISTLKNSSEEESPKTDQNDSELSEAEIKRRKNLFKLISIGNATGQTFLFNFFSAFAVEVGVRDSVLGFITSIRNLMGSLFQGSIGRLSDKIGRKFLLLLGFFLSFSIMIVLIFLNEPIMLIIISIIQATALSIIVPVWNATLGDVTHMRKRAGYIGNLSALGTAVSVSLMLILATVFNYLEKYSGYIIVKGSLEFYIPNIEWRIQYGVAFGVGALNFLICFIGAIFLKETRKNNHEIKQPRMWLALKDKKFARYFIINSAFGLVMAVMWPIFPIAQVDVLGMGFTEIAIINAIFSVCSSLGQFFSGKIGDRIGRKPILIYSRISMFVIPVVMIGAILINDWRLLILSNILGGAAMGAYAVGQNAYILDIAPEEQMGAYSGLLQVGWGIMTFIGSLGAGFIAEAIEKTRDTSEMIILMFSVITALRLFVSFAYFFMDESLPKSARKPYQFSLKRNHVKEI